MEKINIAELLRGCPKGMELYSPLCGDCKLYDVNDYNIRIETPNKDTLISLYHDGRYCVNGEIMLFPKGKTTWEGFHRPFKNGDIIYTKHKLGTEFVSIFQIEYERDICTYWDINLSTNKLIGSLHEGNAFRTFIEKDKIKEQRFATEEEKAKLFNAIKENGYKWNPETKVLEKLPQFKVGDRIKDKNNKTWFVVHVGNKHFNISLIPNAEGYFVPIDNQDDYELVPNKFDINTLKPFESRVLVRDYNSDRWKAAFWGCLTDDTDSFKYDTTRGCYKQCIPYEGNEHLLGKTDDCIDFYKNW